MVCTAIRNLILSAVAFPMLAFAAPPANDTFRVEVKATAQDQYNYASRILSNGSASERPENVIMAVAALEQIPTRWPQERDLSILAYRQAIKYLMGRQLHFNALQLCDEAQTFAGHDPRGKVFVAFRGKTLAVLGRNADARVAFADALDGSFDKLEDFDKVSVLTDAIAFYERAGDLKAATKCSRSLAKYTKGSKNPLATAEWHRKSVDLSLQAGNLVDARADLGQLIDAVAKVRTSNLAPHQIEELRRIDDAIVSYRKKLGV